MEFHKITDIDFSEIKFSKTKSSSGRRFILAYYNKKILGIKFPSLRIPFDSRVNQFGQLELNVSLGNNEVLINKIKDLDTQMQDFCKTNNWFTEEVIPSYTPMLKEANNGNFPPTIKFKVPNKDNIIKTIFYDENKQVIDIKNENQVVDLMTKGTRIQSAIECVGVWFNDNKYGLAWKAEQIRVMSKPEENVNVNEDYSFISSDEEISDTDLLIDDDE